MLDLAAEGSILAGTVFSVDTGINTQSLSHAGAIAHPGFLEDTHFQKLASMSSKSNMVQFYQLTLEQDPSYFRVQVRSDNTSQPLSLLTFNRG